MSTRARAATTSGINEDPLVVYVHGVGQEKGAADLKIAWDIALFGSDRGPETRMAYWADIVGRGPRVKGSKRVRSADADGFTVAGDSTDWLTAALEDAGVSSDAATDYALGVASSLGVAQGIAPVESPGKKVLPLPRFLRVPVSERFLRVFVSDTAAYFFDAKKREAMRARLRAELPTNGRPVTIVAHSHGSIIAVEVLSALATSTSTIQLVTIGSPLGLQEVQDFLDVPPGLKPFEIPRCIERWHNFADPMDPVALDKGLDGDFVASPLRRHGGEQLLFDDVILNGDTRRLIGFNPHSAVGYLAHPKVRRSVNQGARRDNMARFVVARDVAQTLAVEQRHSVLIELLEPGYQALGESPDERDEREARERQGDPLEDLTLATRVANTARTLGALVRSVAADAGDDPDAAVKAAEIDPLRRFVGARLTPSDIQRVAVKHKDLNVYAVWKNTPKRKLLYRSHAALQADAARRSYQASGQGIVWAVLDTGVRASHGHFQTHHTVKAVWDCTGIGRPTLVQNDVDRDGHGSHVSGIIAGEGPTTDGRTGLQGVAPLAKLVVYKVLDDDGSGEDGWIIKALDHIAEQNENAMGLVIHGINLSLGGPYDSTVYGCGYTPICQELRRQWRSGVVVVVASGNEGQLGVSTSDGEVEINTPMSIGDPANLEDCIAVGSVNADRPHLYGVSAFSSRGPTSDGRAKPDVVAPGERITSVNARRVSGDGMYRAESGTSMAAPHVSGLIAAFLSARREYRGRPDDVKRILLDSCTDLGRDRYAQGRGIPNLMKMLLSV